MALGKSIKMYLTIFVATTCMYMILYQYHISRQPMPQPDIFKHKSKAIDNLSTNGIGGSYTSSFTASLSTSSSSNVFLSSKKSAISAPSSSTPSSSPSSSSSSSSLASANKTAAVSALPLSSQQSSSRSFDTLTRGTTNILKKIQLFLWSPMSFLSSSKSSASTLRERLQQQQEQAQQEIISQVEQMTKQFNTASADSDSASAFESSLQATGINDMSMNNNNTLLTSSTSLSASTTSTSSSSSSSSSSPSSSSSSTSTTSTIQSSATNDKTALSSASASASASALTRTQQQQQQQQQLRHKTNRFYKNYNNKNNNNNSHNKNRVNPSSQSLETPFDTPPLYIITPTYRRPEQLAELTRLGYTLKNVPNLLWLVIEDANKTSEQVMRTLNRIGVPYEYFLAPMPEEYKKTKKAKPRGVSNRNRGLKWLRENATEGVFYFADDDNTYDINIFEQMRFTKKVSMWPVGLVTKYGVSSPIIKNGKIIGFYDGWIGGRKYPVDMAGFAVSVRFLHERPDAKMPFKPGYEEDGFLKSLAPLNTSEIELLANNCTEILTWHTQTKKNTAPEKLNTTKYGDTNIMSLDRNLVRT